MRLPRLVKAGQVQRRTLYLLFFQGAQQTRGLLEFVKAYWKLAVAALGFWGAWKAARKFLCPVNKPYLTIDDTTNEVVLCLGDDLDAGTVKKGRNFCILDVDKSRWKKVQLTSTTRSDSTCPPGLFPSSSADHDKINFKYPHGRDWVHCEASLQQLQGMVADSHRADAPAPPDLDFCGASCFEAETADRHPHLSDFHMQQARGHDARRARVKP